MARFSKRLFLFLIGISFSLYLFPEFSSATPLKSAITDKTIVVLGDSLSAAYGIPQHRGWVALLQQKLRDNSYPYKVINASVTGETTSGGRTRISKLIKKHNPNIVILELGGNDGLRGKSISHIRLNLEQIILACKKVGVRVLLVGLRLPPNYGAKYTSRFTNVYKTLASKHRLDFVPQLLRGVDEDLDRMQADGIHPLQETQPHILDNVWIGLKKML